MLYAKEGSLNIFLHKNSTNYLLGVLAHLTIAAAEYRGNTAQ